MSGDTKVADAVEAMGEDIERLAAWADAICILGASQFKLEPLTVYVIGAALLQNVIDVQESYAILHGVTAPGPKMGNARPCA